MTTDTPPESLFTPQEAQALVDLVESAPLRHMRHAEAVTQLLRRFKAFYESTQPSSEDDPTSR